MPSLSYRVRKARRWCELHHVRIRADNTVMLYVGSQHTYIFEPGLHELAGARVARSGYFVQKAQVLLENILPPRTLENVYCHVEMLVVEEFPADFTSSVRILNGNEFITLSDSIPATRIRRAYEPAF